MKSRKRKWERVIGALLETGGNIKESAAIIEAGETTIWRYLQDAAFRREYAEARSRVLDCAIARLQRASGEAVDVLRQVMNTEETPAPRVSAARSILDFAIKGAEIESLRQRIEALEDRLLK